MAIKLTDVQDLRCIHLHEAEEGWYWIVSETFLNRPGQHFVTSEQFYEYPTKAFVEAKNALAILNKEKKNE